MAQWLPNPTRHHEVAGSIPGELPERKGNTCLYKDLYAWSSHRGAVVNESD